MELIKEKVKKTSKVSFIMFSIAIAILVVYANVKKDETIELPTIVVVYLLISTVVALLCFMAAFILDAIESIKKGSVSYVMELLRMIVLYFCVYAGANILLNKNTPNLQMTFLSAVIFACISRVGRNIYRN